ncbi:MAG TPA: AAA family ATPase [Anaerohalosphaeraceae bacterium]|nr:AAA family ATPase [Anaerohalosphaeraceae bacterium]
MRTNELQAFTQVLGNTPTMPQESRKPLPPTVSPAEDCLSRAIQYASTFEGAAEGSRNQKAFEYAARLREKFSLSDTDLLAVLEGWNGRNNPPLDQDELSGVVDNADRYARKPAGAGYTPRAARKENAVAKNATPGQGYRLKIRSCADIQPQEVEYIIPEILPSGCYVSLVSQEGEGKSTVTANWSSNISHVGDVLLFSHEESPDKIIVPRLRANGADLSRVHLGESIINGSGLEDGFDFEKHIQLLHDLAIDLPELKLVIFDPITSYTEAQENSNYEVRRALRCLVDFAEKRNISVLGLTHLSKKVDLKMINRTIGSRAWSSTPRVIWGIQRETVENDEGRKVEGEGRFLLCIKNNLGPKPQGLKFSIRESGLVVFDSDRVDINIDDAIDAGGRTASRSDEIGGWLIQRLGNDAVPQKEVADEARRVWGISEKRLGQIASDHGIRKRLSVARNCWVWSIKK